MKDNFYNNMELARIIQKSIYWEPISEKKKEDKVLLGFWYVVIFIVGFAFGYFLK